MLQIRVHFRSGAKQGTVEVFPTNRYDSLYCGRDPGCDVRFDPDADAVVSRSHAVIEWQPSAGTLGWRVQISDLLSSNGTFVNDRPVTGATTLHPGDRVRFGRGGPEVVIEFGPGTPDGAPPRSPKPTQEIPKADLAATMRGRTLR